LSTRKLKEVLRLRFELGLGQRQIARRGSIGHGRVYEYLQRAQAVGVTWPLPEGWDDRRREEALFGPAPRHVYETRTLAPDFARLHEELQRHPHLTLQWAWEEYRQAHPDGYGYRRFGELYQPWRQQLDMVVRQEHQAGEKLFVDYAGATIPVHDPQGGPVRQASIFVAVLGASNYTSAEATASQELENWIRSHSRAFEFLGGVPKRVIPDNPRSGVNRACRYEPDLNRTDHELAMHDGVGVLPTRPYKPRDKAKVENGVQVVERWIVAARRHRKFFSLAELNPAIRERLAKLHPRPFRKRPGCRADLFGKPAVRYSAAVSTRPHVVTRPAESHHPGEDDP
jgi:transposase